MPIHPSLTAALTPSEILIVAGIALIIAAFAGLGLRKIDIKSIVDKYGGDNDDEEDENNDKKDN